MSSLIYKERLKLTLLWIFICVFCINAFDDRCADYLMSGWNGLNDSQFYLDGYPPINEKMSGLRLYGANRWETSDTNQHLVFGFWIIFTSQMTFTAFISSAFVQTRMLVWYLNSALVWVPVDGGKEFFHTSPGLQPQFHFFGANVTDAFHFYVESYGTPSMQFDIVGCDTVKEDRFEGEDLKSFAFVPLAVENLPSGSVLGENVTTHMDCGELCFDLTSCVAFSSDTETGLCIGYDTNLYGNFPQGEIRHQPLQERQSYYFFNYGLTRTLDYSRNASVILMYRVYTVRKTQIEAARYCTRFGADLLIISNIQQMTSVREKISSSTVLSHEGPYFIGGIYSAGGWQYKGNSSIPNQLWSASPNPNTGHCVVLANDGLHNYECDKELFFICAI